MTIDWWTLGIQTVNVAILVWLLAHFFWRPVATMIEQRRVTAQQILADAEAKRDQANKAVADVERIRAGFDKEREAILAAAREEAEHAGASILASTAKEAALAEASARMAIEKERDAAEKALAERASRLAVDIARRLLARLDGPEVNAAFLDGLLQEIRTLPATTRDAVAANGIVLEVRSPTPIDSVAEEHYRQVIGEAFEAHPQIIFKVDPGLIAGLEMHGPHLLVSNSWRADLNTILAEITHDDRPR